MTDVKITVEKMIDVTEVGYIPNIDGEVPPCIHGYIEECPIYGFTMNPLLPMQVKLYVLAESKMVTINTHIKDFHFEPNGVPTNESQDVTFNLETI